jgi:hypothetical protein
MLALRGSLGSLEFLRELRLRDINLELLMRYFFKAMTMSDIT